MRLTVPDKDYLYCGVHVRVWSQYLGTTKMSEQYRVVMGGFTLAFNNKDKLHKFIDACNTAIADIYDKEIGL